MGALPSLLPLYGVAIAASVVLGVALALLGCHVAARDRAMQTLCIGQGAMLGVLLGVGLTSSVFNEEQLFQSIPFGLGIVFAAATYYGSEALVAAGGVAQASRNTHFAALFAALLAGGSLVSSLFPALESHLAQKYFGELATLGQADAWLVLIVGALLLAWLVWRHRELSRDGFQAQILGARQDSLAGGTPFWLALATLLTICFAVQTVGFLFTVACLFVPTSLVARSRRPGLTRHVLRCAVVAGLGAGGGFLLSLTDARLPTVPVIVVVMVAVGAVAPLLP